jgi:Polyketide cyclase / dehydrase and lipid transport
MIKKVILGIVVVVVVIVAVFAIVVALRPAHYHVERTANMNAPASVVFAQVNDFHKWEAWSPWAKLDPAMKQSYEGAPSGAGAIYTWAGNDQIGEGRMTITDSHPSDLIKIKLEFIRPWTATNATNFTFNSQGNQTAVKWTMDGDNNFMGKAFSLFMNMDKMIGDDFDKGLAQMKSVAEKAAVAGAQR